jgi:HD-GYP domain-containing protein (c-di-GMP phosphodiesterase class II)
VKGLLKKEDMQAAQAEPVGDAPESIVEKTERGRREVLYLAMVLILILGIGVVVYAFNFEMLNGLFKSEYFNNMVRVSLSLLILAFIGWLAYRERNYSRQSGLIFNQLKKTTAELEGRLDDLTTLLEVSKLVAIAEDLHGRLESKMPHMKGHWKRVSFYAVEIARKMELDDNYIRLIERAANLMDIGMLQVADNLSGDLLRSESLSPGDKEIIKRHPVIGADMLSAIRPNWEIIPLVRSHHEWWNGMGYPDGLKGEAIPMGARILAIADAFVAMTSWRSYRVTMEAKEATKEINAYSGVQFDPRVVRAFLAVVTPRIYGMGGDADTEDEMDLLREINGVKTTIDTRDQPLSF